MRGGYRFAFLQCQVLNLMTLGNFSMAFISNKYKTLEERKKAVRSWYQQLLAEADATDSFYRDRFYELVDTKILKYIAGA